MSYYNKLRDELAMAALPGLIAEPKGPEVDTPIYDLITRDCRQKHTEERIAIAAYRIADAMIKVRCAPVGDRSAT